MSYKYREVKCPWCDHVFMWDKNGGEGILVQRYRLKSTGEPVKEAKCPQCGMKMVVLEHVFTGIDKEDDEIIMPDKKDFPPFSD